MTTPRFVRLTALALFVAVIAVAGFGLRSVEAVAATTTATTLDNLNAAFNGESNAHARYLAFAKKADEEGYGEVASLFRAAARAEEIHAANHAAVIKKLGGVPKADVQAPDVKSTKENLEAAIKGESYERDTMYPEFLAKARKEGQRDAIETFNFAKSAEAEHAKLYTARAHRPRRPQGQPGQALLRLHGVRQHHDPAELREVPGVLQLEGQVRPGELTAEREPRLVSRTGRPSGLPSGGRPSPVLSRRSNPCSSFPRSPRGTACTR